FSTVYLSFKFVKLVCENYFGGKFNFDLLTFSFVLFSFSLPGIFSGLRFAFAGSIFSLGIYFLLTREQNPRNIIFSFSLFTLSILTHFSYIGLFLPVLVILLKMRRIKLNILLIVSILLLFVAPLTKGYFESILKLISLPEGYSNKTSLYLEMENSNTFNSEVLLFVKSLWFYFLPIILFLDRAKTHLCPIVIATYFIVCIVSFVDTAFIRYMLFLKLLVVPYLILLLYSGRLKFGFFFGFFLLYFLGFCIDLLVLRNNILASFTSGMWNIFSIFYDTRASYMNVVGS
ncbi:EpsG family protein, partial [Pseudoalteromonas sp. Angola-20]|uniref:EpsG family protein n=3 Tax=Pseudoalteromonas TaxID=53246 RepID=UPI00235A0EE5